MPKKEFNVVTVFGFCWSNLALSILGTFGQISVNGLISPLLKSCCRLDRIAGLMLVLGPFVSGKADRD